MGSQSDDAGVARFRDLATGDAIGYAARSSETTGLRLVPRQSHGGRQGMRGEIRASRGQRSSVLRSHPLEVHHLGMTRSSYRSSSLFKTLGQDIRPRARRPTVALPGRRRVAKEIEVCPAGGSARPGHVYAPADSSARNNAAMFALQMRVGFYCSRRNVTARAENKPRRSDSNIFTRARGDEPDPEGAGPACPARRDRAQGQEVKIYELPTSRRVASWRDITGLPDSTTRTHRAAVRVLAAVVAASWARAGPAPPGAAGRAEKLAERRGENCSPSWVAIDAQGRRDARAARGSADRTPARSW